MYNDICFNFIQKTQFAKNVTCDTLAFCPRSASEVAILTAPSWREISIFQGYHYILTLIGIICCIYLRYAKVVILAFLIAYENNLNMSAWVLGLETKVSQYYEHK